MSRIIHLIPYDATGGVEVAARTMQGIRANDLDFSVQSIYVGLPRKDHQPMTFGLAPLLAALKKIHEQCPDVLIVSLWRACIVGVLVKLARPSTRLVLMLHNTLDVHWLDRWVTRVTAFLAEEWWGDSSATLQDRIQHSRNKTKRVISFVTCKLQARPSTALSPNFIFWGRIHPQKGLDRAVRLFAKVLALRPDSKFIVIGPDLGALPTVQEVIQQLNIADSVEFKGEMSMSEIIAQAESANFYLQTSHYEGMAMSVVEAMQLGLVPVVTPVGEIRNYCVHLENSIILDSFDTMPDALIHSLENAEFYKSLSAKARATWADKPLYSESMLSACQALLNKLKH